MKKIVKVSALALLAMGLVFNFASCSNGDDDSGSEEQQVEETTQSGQTSDTTGSGDATVTVKSATLSYSATDEAPEFALTAASSSGVISGGSDFTAAAIGSFGGVTTYTLADGYPKVEGNSFTPSDATNAKVKDILDGGKAKLTGYTLKSTLQDGSTKIALTKGEDCATVDYTFTLAAAADVSVDVVAFNTQSGNFYGKVSILDSTSSVKATSGEKDTGSKEDNDASVTASSLAAGTYTVRFAWCPKADIEASKGVKTFLGGVQSVTIAATTK